MDMKVVGGKMEPCEFYTLDEIAAYAKVHRQTVYLAVRHGKLPAFKKNKRIMLTKEDYDQYRINKYTPDHRRFNGEKLFDLDQGLYCLNQVAKILSSVLQIPFAYFTVLRMVRRGEINSFRKGRYYVVTRTAVEKYLQMRMGYNPLQLEFQQFFPKEA